MNYNDGVNVSDILDDIFNDLSCEQTQTVANENTVPNFQIQRKNKDKFFSRLLGKEITVEEWSGAGRCKDCAYADCCVNGVYNLLDFRRFEAGRCSGRMREDGKNITFKAIKDVYPTNSELLKSLSKAGDELTELGEDPEEIVKYQNFLLTTYLVDKTKDEDGN